MTAYELVNRCDGAIDKESMEKLLAEKNDVPLSVVQFLVDNRERLFCRNSIRRKWTNTGKSITENMENNVEKRRSK